MSDVASLICGIIVGSCFTLAIVGFAWDNDKKEDK